jgi:galactoside O-acetyltransferase
MFNPGYWREDDLRGLGWSVGRNVMVAKNCTIVGTLEIGDNVRIDGFTTIGSGRLTLGSNIHIGGYCFIAPGAGVTLEDFSGLSQRVSIYSTSDDYSGEALTNPTVPAEFTNVRSAPVILRRHVIVGSGSVILPGVEIGEGSAVGALALVTRSLEPWGLYGGQPARLLRRRSMALLDKEKAYLAREGRS